MVSALVSACERINADQSVRVAILTGAGSAFSSGGNVKDMKDKAGMFGGSANEIREGYRKGYSGSLWQLMRWKFPSLPR